LLALNISAVMSFDLLSSPLNLFQLPGAKQRLGSSFFFLNKKKKKEKRKNNKIFLSLNRADILKKL